MPKALGLGAGRRGGVDTSKTEVWVAARVASLAVTGKEVKEGLLRGIHLYADDPIRWVLDGLGGKGGECLVPHSVSALLFVIACCEGLLFVPFRVRGGGILSMYSRKLIYHLHIYILVPSIHHPKPSPPHPNQPTGGSPRARHSLIHILLPSTTPLITHLSTFSFHPSTTPNQNPTNPNQIKQVICYVCILLPSTTPQTPQHNTTGGSPRARRSKTTKTTKPPPPCAPSSCASTRRSTRPWRSSGTASTSTWEGAWACSASAWQCVFCLLGLVSRVMCMYVYGNYTAKASSTIHNPLPPTSHLPAYLKKHTHPSITYHLPPSPAPAPCWRR